MPRYIQISNNQKCLAVFFFWKVSSYFQFGFLNLVEKKYSILKSLTEKSLIHSKIRLSILADRIWNIVYGVELIVL